MTATVVGAAGGRRRRPGTRRWPPRSRSSSARCACWAGSPGWASWPICCPSRCWSATWPASAVIMIVGQLGKSPACRSTATPSSSELIGRSSRHLDEIHGPTAACCRVCVLVLLLVGSAPLPRARRCRCVAMLLARRSPSRSSTSATTDLGGRATSPPGCRCRACPTCPLADLAALLLPARRRHGRRIHRQRAHRARLRRPQRATGSTPTRSCSRSARPTSATGLIHGFPVSSSGSRTVIGDALGSRSQLYSLVAVASSSLTLLFLRPGARDLPGRRARRHRDLRRRPADRRRRVPPARAGSAAASCSWRWPPPSAVLARRHPLRGPGRGRRCRSSTCCAGWPARTTPSSARAGVAGMHDVDDYPDASTVPGPGGLPLRLAAVLRQRRGLPQPRAGRRSTEPVADTEWFVLNAEANVEVDITAVGRAGGAARRARPDAASCSRMARVKQDLRDELAAAGLVERIGEERHLPDTLPTAVEAYTGTARCSTANLRRASSDQIHLSRRSSKPDRLPSPARPSLQDWRTNEREEFVDNRSAGDASERR